MKTVRKLWFENERIYIETVDGMVRSQPLAFFPRLKQATNKERSQWTESYFGIHWEKVDEDISFESFNWGENNPLTLYHHDISLPKAFLQP